MLSSNPNLANIIERKGHSKAVSSIKEMRNATAALDQTAALMRKKQQGKAALKIDDKELTKAMREDDFFKPHVEVMDAGFFSFPKGTRIILINTPLLFRLMLVRNDDKLKILWADPYTGD